MRTTPRIVEEQILRWQMLHREPEEKKASMTITISRDPGSGGRIIAEKLAEKLGFQVFQREVLHAMAKDANVSEYLLNTLDEKGLSVLEDWISSLIYERHLWPDQYLRHLMKVVGAIGKHGRAVIVGRGANFILPPEKQFRVRITAPQKLRIEHVAHHFNVPKEEAKRRVIRTESDRRAFIRKYFNSDIADPVNYDLTLNTETLSVDNAVNVVSAALGCVVECKIDETEQSHFMTYA
jgi:cytidylate kinase